MRTPTEKLCAPTIRITAHLTYARGRRSSLGRMDNLPASQTFLRLVKKQLSSV